MYLVLSLDKELLALLVLTGAPEIHNTELTLDVFDLIFLAEGLFDG